MATTTTHDKTFAAIGVFAGIMFIVIIAFVIPYKYNDNLHSAQTHTAFCSNLKSVLDNPDGSQQPANVTIAYLNQYSELCSK